MDEIEQKAPAQVEALLDLPQERITGDILRGYGPRRGNLERLLRYWRPIMRKPGGFRRCRRILADHPELYPLERLCAWLHHETTGLWPNEGCHHPGMTNCRGKIRKGVRGSLWSDRDFNDRMRRRFRRGKKGLNAMENYVVTESDWSHASSVLKDFCAMEKGFLEYLRDDKNWIHEGQDEAGNWVQHEWSPSKDSGCGCGCGDA